MVLCLVGVVLLLVLAWTGIAGGVQQLSGMHTTAQRIQTALQLALGITSALAVIGTVRVVRWRRAAYIAFVASATLAAGLAPYAWGQAGLGSSVAAGVGALVVAMVIVWLARVGARLPTGLVIKA